MSWRGRRAKRADLGARGKRWGWVVWGAAAAVAVALAAWWGSQPADVQRLAAAEVVLYQAPECACCGEYAAYLRQAGYSVRVQPTRGLVSLKDRLGVPPSLRSCHTAVVGRYFVEGHVPAEAIAKLLRQSPRWLGIALPGMPLGSPGMPGPREGPLVVYAVTAQGRWTEFGLY